VWRFLDFARWTVLFVGYLLEHQRTVRKLKQGVLAELDRNVTYSTRPAWDLLQTMPDQNHFWDRLTMEFRRAMTMKKTLFAIAGKGQAGKRGGKNGAQLGSVGRCGESDLAQTTGRRIRSTPRTGFVRVGPSRNRRAECEADCGAAARRAAGKNPRQASTGV